ncbi:MAG TPA: hypothetical protein VM871_01375 [Flavisolibacter sp.]|nr:hypothetical protein [Flavisolibacter sp.]
MRKLYWVLAGLFALHYANGQEGKNQLGVGAEIGPFTQGNQGIPLGASVKYMHGVGRTGQATLTVGYNNQRRIFGPYRQRSSSVAVLLGFRKYFNNFYAEPQVGYHKRYSKTEQNGRQLYAGSSDAFAYAIVGGYAFPQGPDIGLSLLRTSFDDIASQLVLRFGYNFSLSRYSAANLPAQKLNDSAKRFIVSIGPHFGLADKDTRYRSKYGTGAALQGEYLFSRYLSGAVAARSVFFKRKPITTFLGGLRFYPVAHFFLGGEIGYGTGGYTGGTGSYEPQMGLNSRKFQIVVAYNGLVETDYAYNHFGLTTLFKL